MNYLRHLIPIPENGTKLIVITFLLLLTYAGMGQKGTVIQNKATLFQITQEKDTIEFIVADTVLTEKKPVLLWCQGSLPVPLFCEIEGYGYYFFGGGVSNFDYEGIKKHYHLVIISMPGTPVLAEKAFLNAQFHFIPDKAEPNRFSDKYTAADYLDNYLKRARAVLAFLRVQTWADNNKLVVAGHSQGSKIATKIAVCDPNVTHLGLFGANPFGRADQFIRQARLDAQLGKTSWTEADSIMNDHYKLFEDAHNPDSLKANPGLKSWKTFSEPFFDDWLNLSIPIFLAYGTEDRTADLCDIIPLLFIREGKHNLTLKRYLGLEHNFFEVDKAGRTIYEKAHWNAVMKTFLEWAN